MPEQQNIEWKREWKDSFLKQISSLANSQGGVLTIGKDDSGKLIGLDNIEKLLEVLPSKIINHLGISCKINLGEKDGLEYIDIIVDQSTTPVACDGRYFIRSGSTTRLLTG